MEIKINPMKSISINRSNLLSAPTLLRWEKLNSISMAPGGMLEHLGNINMGQHMSQMC